MNPKIRTLIAAALLLAATPLLAQDSVTAIQQQLKIYRSIPAAERPPIFLKLAAQISALSAGTKKVELADTLVNEVTEGDNGLPTLQAAGDTLANSLIETPLAAKGDRPPDPYFSLAKIVRYMNVTTTLNDPLYVKAGQILADEDADVQKADFTLKDLQGKDVTLSKLRGKVVLVNFWATWCPPCRMELPDINALAARLQSKGLVVLPITHEDAAKVNPFLAKNGYQLHILLDPEGKVFKQFHVDGIPKTFVFNREGKLVGVAIDQTGERQFLAMLAKAGLD
ncbi:MAG: TlpA disulfide reductase family protein [Terracidiphilus sp.]|jgi:peroxiredoxin